jgi:hypothetical protein
VEQPGETAASKNAVPPLPAKRRRPAIRSGEDPQRRRERISLDRPAAQRLHQRRLSGKAAMIDRRDVHHRIDVIRISSFDVDELLPSCAARAWWRA